MKKTILVTTACLGVLGLKAQTTCATAISLIAASYYCTFTAGSEVPGPICVPGGTVATMGHWYSYTSPVDTTVTISTAASGLDTRVHVYTGSCGDLTCYAGDDDNGPGLTSVCTFSAEAGVTYIIAFDNRWSSTAFAFSLSVSAPIVPPEGLVTFTPMPLTGVSGSTYGVVDMNGDFLDDVVSVSASNINILQQGAAGTLTAHNYATDSVDFPATWSMSAGDLDNNGFNDLQYGDYGGVTYMMANSTGTGYAAINFSLFVFSQRGNMVDINNDGWLDAFMCHDIDANVYYINDGTGNLTFNQGGFGSDCGNYGSVWTDYDGDGDIDLFIAKCGCDPIDIMMRNNGDGSFTSVAADEGFADSQQSWSSAWGDFDNDGDMDALIGSSGSSFHKLMRNNGDGTFTNVTAGSGFDSFGGTSIEWNTRDFNNDGHLDIIGGGAIMYGNGDLTFFPDDDAPDNGAIGDLNNDGFLDIVNYGAYINNANANHWLTVNLIGTASNKNGIGAKVYVTSALGTQMREIRSGDGFKYMSSLNAHFGLGADSTVDLVEVHWPSGDIDQLYGPASDGSVTITEGTLGITAGVAATEAEADMAIYPNPVADVLTLAGPGRSRDTEVAVFDVTGKRVLEGRTGNGRLDVSALRPGMYVLSMHQGDHVEQHRFVKQ